MYIRNINKLKPNYNMNIVNIALNTLFGTLSVTCFSMIAYAFGVVIIKLV